MCFERVVSFLTGKWYRFRPAPKSWLKIPDWICLETYNVNASKIKILLEQKFPEYRNQDNVKILLIQQTQ
jgi:hypothetical protein